MKSHFQVELPHARGAPAAAAAVVRAAPVPDGGAAVAARRDRGGAAAASAAAHGGGGGRHGGLPRHQAARRLLAVGGSGAHHLSDTGNVPTTLAWQRRDARNTPSYLTLGCLATFACEDAAGIFRNTPCWAFRGTARPFFGMPPAVAWQLHSLLGLAVS